MKKSLRFIILSVFVLCFGINAFAQTTTTGSIEGTVVDVNGAAVPGVTVTATRQGGRHATATADDQGVFRIQNIEPGIYTVTVQAEKGFAKFEQGNVPVNLSTTSSVTVQLRPQGTAATVDVTDSSGSAIDVTQNTTGTNVSTEQFSNFPTQRTVQSLYTIAPTVNRSGLRDSSGRERDPRSPVHPVPRTTTFSTALA